MAHFPKPFFKKSRNTWYVQIGPKQINLGPDRDAAFQRYHELMAKPDAPAAPPPEGMAIAQVLDLFLDWCQKHKAARTYDWYRGYLQSFLDALPPALTVAALKPFHVQQWLDRHPDWTTGRRGAVAAVQRPLNWAVRSGYIQTNPIKGIERVEAGRRQSFLTTEQFRTLIAAVKDRAFLDVLETCWDTGCRPNEVMVVEACHVDLVGGRWVLPPEKSKGKKRQRVVYLTDRALEITRRRMRINPHGPLFRNRKGRPWTRSTFNCRFRRLKEKTGILCSLYAIRHSYATRVLASGTVDAVTCSLLLGHRDTSQLARHYAHLLQVPEHLRNAARRSASA